MSETSSNLTFHYYATGLGGWGCGETIEECIRIAKAQDGGCTYSLSLWVVPVPVTAPYKINHYRPMVAGARFIDLVPTRKLKPAEKARLDQDRSENFGRTIVVTEAEVAAA
jgi:hypothetical protein